jgi:hypothetical protein
LRDFFTVRSQRGVESVTGGGLVLGRNSGQAGIGQGAEVGEPGFGEVAQAFAVLVEGQKFATGLVAFVLGAGEFDGGAVYFDLAATVLDALAFDLLPAKLRPKAFAHLVDLIEARGCHLTTGFVGTPLLLPVLTGMTNLISQSMKPMDMTYWPVKEQTCQMPQQQRLLQAWDV